MMSKSRVFVFITISFALGILIASAFNFPSQVVYLVSGLAFGSFAIGNIFENKVGAFAALFLFCAALGALRLQSSIIGNQYQDLIGNKQQLEGYIVEDPQLGDKQQTLTFRPKGFSQDIKITTTLGQQLFYGDRVVVDGKIAEVKNFQDGFDYQKYLQRFNIYAQINYPKILILKSHQLNPLKEWLLKIKAAYIKRAAGFLDEPEKSLNLGILIGGHSNLPKEIISNFNNTGTSHIIAVSGFNITIIIMALAWLAYAVGRRGSVWLGMAIITAFVIITGASASVIRAGVMGSLLLLSLSIGRQYSITPSLFLAALVMLLLNPKILYWDAGFQLSFAATLGIVYFYPLLEKLTENWPKLLGAKELLLATLSAIVATLPLILLNFGTLSFVTPMVNVLILPVVPYAMLFGFLVATPYIGSGFAMVANIFLKYILAVTGFFAHLPYAYASVQIPLWVFWLMVLAVFAIYFGLKFLLERNSEV